MNPHQPNPGGQLAHARLAAALRGYPDLVTADDIAEATGRRRNTVLLWAAEFPDFPKPVEPDRHGRTGPGHPVYRDRREVATWLRTHAGELVRTTYAFDDHDPEEIVGWATIAERIDRKPSTVRSYPSMYRNSDDPFPEPPPGEPGNVRRWADVRDWLLRRGDLSGAGGPKPKGSRGLPAS